MISQELLTDAAGNAQIAVRASDLVLALKQLGSLSQTIQTAVSNCAVAELAVENEIRLTASEIQTAADEFRAERRLFSAAETERWLNDQGMTADDLEQLAANKAKFRSLAMLIPMDAVERYFSAHQVQFELVQLAVIWLPDLSHCEEVLMQVHEGAEFQNLARRFSRHASASEGGNLGLCEAGQLDPEIADCVKDLQPAETSRLIAWDSGFALIRLEARLPGNLDDRLAFRIRTILLNDQIQGRLRNCGVQVLV